MENDLKKGIFEIKYNSVEVLILIYFFMHIFHYKPKPQLCKNEDTK